MADAPHAPDGTTLLHRLAGHVRERPGKPFLVLCRGERFEAWTYADLADRAHDWAGRLGTYTGRAPEPRVAFIVASHGIDAYAAFLGAMRAGLVPSFLPPPTVRQSGDAYVETHQRVIARTRPAVVVTPAVHAAAIGAAAGELAPLVLAEGCGAGPNAPVRAELPRAGDLAVLQHSSGTTGLKKGVALDHRLIGDHVAMVAQATGFAADDIVASWLPLYHDMGLVTGFLAPLMLGASVVALDPFAWVAEPASWLRAVERHRASLAWLPNFAFAHLARTRPTGERFDLSSLRLLNDCSEPCRAETVATFLRAFPDAGIDGSRVGCCYGLAEIVFAATQTRPGQAPRTLDLDAEALEHGEVLAPSGRVRRRTLMSCGPTLPGVELRIDAPRGRAGEVLVRSRTAVDRYFGADDPDPAIDAEGWRRTGDIGLIDRGELFVCGRIKELVIVRGRNLYAGDVEAAVSAVPGVKPGRAAVVALDDAASGSETLGVLLECADPGLDEAGRIALERAVRAAVRERFDVGVAEIAIGPPGSLAKSTAGKMSRAENLARLRALRPDEPASSPPGEGTTLEKPQFEDPQFEDPGVVRLPLFVLVETVARALGDCFGHDPAQVDAATGPDDVAGWDSLGHTILMLRLEKAVGLRLDEEAAGARTVGEIAQRLACASALQRRAA